MGDASSPPDQPTTALVLAGGAAVSPHLAGRLPPFDFVVAADSGAHNAEALNVTIDVAVGDFDSIDQDLLQQLEETAAIQRHATAKDKTDLELALDTAVSRGATRVVLVSGGRGRLDHAFANLLVLAAPAYEDIDVHGFIGDAHVQVVRTEQRLEGAPGDTVSLFALGGPATGVRTAGLQYPLEDETLEVGSTRGVSNVFNDTAAAVRLTTGVVLAVQPEHNLKGTS